jgi:hypothetical protein
VWIYPDDLDWWEVILEITHDFGVAISEAELAGLDRAEFSFDALLRWIARRVPPEYRLAD